MIRRLRVAATPALACSLGAAARPGWPLRPLLLPASLCWTSGPTAGHAQVASAPAPVGPDLACAGAWAWGHPVWLFLGGPPGSLAPGRPWFTGVPRRRGPPSTGGSPPSGPPAILRGRTKIQEGATGPKAGVEMNWNGRQKQLPGPGQPCAHQREQRPGPNSKRGQMKGAGRQPPRHPWPALSATLLDAGSGEAPREREEMEPTGFGPWGRSHGPARAPLPALPSGLWLLHVQLVPWWRQISTTRPGAPGRAGWTASDWSSAAQDTAGQQGRGPGGDEEGVGRRGQMRLGLTCYPGGSLSYPASVCLPIGWVPAGGSGDRGARRRLGAGCAASRGLALPWAATFRRPPANAAPGRGS